MTLVLKENYIAWDKDKNLYWIYKIDEENDFYPVKTVRILKWDEPVTDIHVYASYTYNRDGSYGIGEKGEYDLIDSVKLKRGDRFKLWDGTKYYEYLEIHDLKGVFEFIDKSGSERPDWLK